MKKSFVFEDEVRRIARARWPQAAYGGAFELEGRERDGKFETDECVHFVEATTRRDAAKAREDTKKLFRCIQAQSKITPHKASRGWLVTQYEPTADQRSEVHDFGKTQVVICSFSQFQQALVDASSYLSARSDHYFGSVLDPQTGSTTPSIKYVALDIYNSRTGDSLTADEIADSIAQGSRYVLLGDYGAGKSMTLRQLFFRLRDTYLANSSRCFPIYLNLREHSGQDDPTEVLERHARRIGFSNPSSLVTCPTFSNG